MRTSQSLTLKDALTGATAEVPITGACIPSLAFAKLNPIPIRVYDPGYKNTTVCRTKVSRIDPPNGISCISYYSHLNNSFDTPVCVFLCVLALRHIPRQTLLPRLRH